MDTIGLVAVVAFVVWWTTRVQAVGENTDMMHDPQDDTLPTVSAGMSALASAIATAEGFGVPGAVPTRAHNPGDLIIPGWTGPTLGAEGISVFASDADGWRRLFHQLTLIATSRSTVYTRDDTFLDFAAKWTATEQGAWLANVLTVLQANGYPVASDSPLSDVLG